MKILVIALVGLLVISLHSNVWATTDLSTLPSPDVMISPTSGPPGTKITITIYNLPDISNENYPYPDLYVYMPFSQSFGQGLQSHCDRLDCFPVYTHDDALKHNLVNRTITFSLPSVNNPNPVFLNGMENSICDIILNGKTVERFSTLCNTKNEPEGVYKINIGWTLESDLEQIQIIKTIQFTVTKGISSQTTPTANNGDLIIKEYQNGTISQSTFYTKLHSLGWDDEQIRQALAVIGKLPHQMGVFGPDDTLPITSENSSMGNITKPIQTNHTEITISNIANNSNVNDQSISVSEIKNNTIQPVKQESIPIVGQDYSLNNMIIVLSIVAVSVMSGTIFVTKKLRGSNKNAG